MVVGSDSTGARSHCSLADRCMHAPPPCLAARKTALMVGIMAAHALGEGCAVGVSFCGDRGWAQVG